jgi:DNA-repair protein XRCC2
MSAEDLGKKLLGEVEEVGLDEVGIHFTVPETSDTNTLQILTSLRNGNDGAASTCFGIPPLDAMLQCLADIRSSTTTSPSTPPVLELMSLAPGGGKTQFLYHLIAIAVLTKSQGGRQGAVVILDADGRFSVPRLAQQITSLLTNNNASGEGVPSPSELGDAVLAALRHVHIFHPHSLASTTATLRSLPAHLFDPSAHHSFDRAIAFIALDSASAFYWQYRSDVDDAALPSAPDTEKPSTRAQQAYSHFLSSLKHASEVLNAPLFYTARHLGPLKDSSCFGPSSRSFRPSLPPPWPSLPTLRLVVHRTPVRKLPVQISVEEARRESVARQKAVVEGRFECFVNEFGVEERVLQRLRVGGAGFDVMITEEGVSLRSEVLSDEDV